MDDMEVIRLAVAVIIARGIVARCGMETKKNFAGGGESVERMHPDLPTALPLALTDSFLRETPVRREECGSREFRLNFRLVPSVVNPSVQAVSERKLKRKVANDKRT